jgi:hypothetical protein
LFRSRPLHRKPRRVKSRRNDGIITQHTWASFSSVAKIHQADRGGSAAISQEFPSQSSGITGKQTARPASANSVEAWSISPQSEPVLRICLAYMSRYCVLQETRFLSAAESKTAGLLVYAQHSIACSITKLSNPTTNVSLMDRKVLCLHEMS